MSGTNWNAFDLNAMWAMIKDENACHGADRVMAWDGLADVVLAQKARLEKAKASLEMAWPPSKNASAAAFVAEIDKLLASMDETLQRAQDTRASLGGVVEALAKAQDQLRPLVKQRQEASTDLVPRFMDNAEDEIDRKARQIMGEAEAAVSDYATRFQPPAPFTIKSGSFVMPIEVATPDGESAPSGGAGNNDVAGEFSDENGTYGGGSRSFSGGYGGSGSSGGGWSAISIPVPVPHDPPPALPGRGSMESDGALIDSRHSSTSTPYVSETGSLLPSGRHFNEALGLAGIAATPSTLTPTSTDHGTGAQVRPAPDPHLSGPVIGGPRTGGSRAGILGAGGLNAGGPGAGSGAGSAARRNSGGGAGRQPVPVRGGLPSGMVIGGGPLGGTPRQGPAPGTIGGVSQPPSVGRNGGERGAGVPSAGVAGMPAHQARRAQDESSRDACLHPDNPWEVQEGVAPVIEPDRRDTRHGPGPGVIGWDR